MSNTMPPASSNSSESQSPYGDSFPGNPNQGAPLMQPKFNVLAIISFVTAFVVSLAAIITGHIALSQIKKTGERGRGLALAGTILGYLGMVAGTVMLVLLLTVGLSAGTAAVEAVESQQAATQEASTGAEDEPAEDAPAEPAPVEPLPADGSPSPELCAAFTDSRAAFEASGSNDSGSFFIDLLRRAGEAPGPNQAMYEAAYVDGNELYQTNPEAAELPQSVVAVQGLLEVDARACGIQVGE